MRTVAAAAGSPARLHRTCLERPLLSFSENFFSSQRESGQGANLGRSGHNLALMSSGRFPRKFCGEQRVTEACGLPLSTLEGSRATVRTEPASWKLAFHVQNLSLRPSI